MNGRTPRAYRSTKTGAVLALAVGALLWASVPALAIAARSAPAVTSRTTDARAVSGRYYTQQATALREHARSGSAVIKQVDAQKPVDRLSVATDGNGVSWTRVVAGTKRGWVRSSHIAPPFREYVWNGKTPINQQRTNYWCVPATVQTMINMALDKYLDTYARQKTIYTWARKRNLFPYPRGIDPYAWSRALVHFSNGRLAYDDHRAATYKGALRTAARRITATDLPVGILVHSGTHAWNIIGFKATADPSRTDDFRVLGAYITGSFRAWTDPPPGTYYGAKALRSRFNKDYEADFQTPWEGGWAMVLPAR